MQLRETNSLVVFKVQVHKFQTTCPTNFKNGHFSPKLLFIACIVGICPSSFSDLLVSLIFSLLIDRVSECAIVSGECIFVIICQPFHIHVPLSSFNFLILNTCLVEIMFLWGQSLKLVRIFRPTFIASIYPFPPRNFDLFYKFLFCTNCTPPSPGL